MDNSSPHCSLIPAVAAWRLDLGECGAGRDRRWPQAPQQWGCRTGCRAEPLSQSAYSACSASSTLVASPQRLRSATSIDRPARSDHDGTSAASSGERDSAPDARRCSGVLANGFTASRHGPDLRYVTHCSGFGRPMSLPIRLTGVLGTAHPPARGLRRLSPLSSIRWALWMIRSRMASASVGLPTISYQRSIGSWLVMISEPAL